MRRAASGLFNCWKGRKRDFSRFLFKSRRICQRPRQNGIADKETAGDAEIASIGSADRTWMRRFTEDIVPDYRPFAGLIPKSSRGPLCASISAKGHRYASGKAHQRPRRVSQLAALRVLVVRVNPLPSTRYAPLAARILTAAGSCRMSLQPAIH
jgi:hypothetical protein